MKFQYIYTVLLLFLMSCNQETAPEDNENNELNLTFSESPILIDDADVKFVQNINYDDGERNQFDIFLPASDTPTPLVIFIHGGGFFSGDKDVVYEIQQDGEWDYPSDIRDFMSEGIAFATIRYSLLTLNESEGVIKCMNDVKRALQFIRYHAETLNINSDKIAMGGNSAGAGTALWLNFSDDMKTPESDDPVAQQSTRIKAAAARQTQASYHVERWTSDVFETYQLSFNDLLTLTKPIITTFYGMTNFDDEFYTDEMEAYKNSVDMLNLISADDPEFFVDNTQTDVIIPTDYNVLTHHAYHAKILKQYADEAGVSCVAYYGKNPTLYEDQSQERWAEFLIRKLKEE